MLWQKELRTRDFFSRKTSTSDTFPSKAILYLDWKNLLVYQ